ncbi:MAG: nucleotidyl transferase AbiEii/AbiGii toxin family protein [Proteobacteria bacterium]|nr:nucleotidyl transferase AbiEii/AbiGii toxin family protein [Pseudomonadota bacterium]
MLRILPLIHKEEVFGLKGGTAINFFLRDLPRLSVDIDLAYLPVNEREVALDSIGKALVRISEQIKKRVPGARVVKKKIQKTHFVSGLVVRRGDATVKIEPNLVIRGSVFEPEVKSLSTKAEKLFELSMEIRILSKAELYAGKMCAALDRQHPRDLYDIHILLKNEGLDAAIRKAFIVYLISHPRPMIEVLNPRSKDFRAVYENEFKGMMAEKVTFEELLATREYLVSVLLSELSHQERQFIVSMKEGAPRWELLGLEGIQDLPAVRWKLLNITRMNPTKHKEALHKLRHYLGV